MEQSIFLGAGILICIAAWRWMYCPSLLDQTRDRLFDLREEVREYFLNAGYGLNHPHYKVLRDLLNGHLRHTDRFSLAAFVWMIAHFAHDRGFAARQQEELDRVFACGDPVLAEFSRQVRRRGVGLMMEYAVRRSFYLTILSLVVASYLQVRRALTLLANLFVRGGLRAAPAGAKMAAVFSILFAVGAHLGVGSRDAATDALETSALHAKA